MVPRSGTHPWAGSGGKVATVSLVAVGQCQGVEMPRGHCALPCPQSIETLRVDGSGRHSFPAVLRSHTEPLGLAVFESRFFWTDGTELVSATRASPQEHAVLLHAPVSAFTVVHALQQPPSEYPDGCPPPPRGWQHPHPFPGCQGRLRWVLELSRSHLMAVLVLQQGVVGL